MVRGVKIGVKLLSMLKINYTVKWTWLIWLNESQKSTQNWPNKHKNIKHHLELLALCAYIDGILPKGPYPPCLCMADKALLVGYPRYVPYVYIQHPVDIWWDILYGEKHGWDVFPDSLLPMLWQLRQLWRLTWFSSRVVIEYHILGFTLPHLLVCIESCQVTFFLSVINNKIWIWHIFVVTVKIYFR